MRLKCIKLAGFKSFVDPTTIHFPSNLGAVVGPNGCGKSNVIDAVRWVMGESSAKNLRGENMTDVIFNGSGARKPVGQASVELVFDNHDRKLTGEYANFSEVSIKRKVDREAQSTYFLNGTKVRRKDITDIFLGTGLGARSYSIIDAKPKQDPGKSKLDMSEMKIKVDPRIEWQQIYDDAWLVARDWFYDPNIHGMDWPMIKARYQPMIDAASHRSDIDYVLGEMGGELNAGVT